MGRVFALRNVRVFYKKLGRMKFVSHLDMNRFMARLISKSKIPIWYTEGFNQHIYMNFAIPLSLGFEGLYEIMDIRLIDENYSLEDCLADLKKVCPDDIEIFEVSEPLLNMKEITFAEHKISLAEFSEEQKLKLCEFLNRDSVICQKVGKKGRVKEIDIIPKIASFSLQGNVLDICLNAGCEDTLNPALVLSTFFEQCGIEPVFYTVTRTAILDREKRLFK